MRQQFSPDVANVPTAWVLCTAAADAGEMHSPNLRHRRKQSTGQ